MHRLQSILAGLFVVAVLTACGDIHDNVAIDPTADAQTTTTTIHHGPTPEALHRWYAAAHAADVKRWTDTVNANQLRAVAYWATVEKATAGRRAPARRPAEPTPHPAVAQSPHAPTPTPATPPAPGASGACGGDLPSCCTMRLESGGNIYAVEPGHRGAPYGDPGDPWHHASGKWQFMPRTWAGYGGYPYAAAAPEAVQDAKARLTFAGGAGWGNWKGDGCYPGG